MVFNISTSYIKIDNLLNIISTFANIINGLTGNQNYIVTYY